MTNPRPHRYAIASLSVAPGIWLTHFVAIYAATSLACAFAPAAESTTDLLVIGIATTLTLLGLGASGSAIFLAARARRRSRRTGDGGSADRFLAQANMLLHGLAIVGMLWVAAPAFLVAPCVH